MTIPVHLRDPALVLKSSPPRVGRDLLQRERLSLARLDLAGTQVIATLAPTGFGKTSQLAQWRREALARGALAFWLTLDARDEPLRLVSGLAHAAQQSAGKRGFDTPFTAWLGRCTDAREALTGWLAEVARLSVEVLLVLDEVDQAPGSTRTQVITYLLGNAPANLRVALGARPAGALMVSGELSRTPHTRVLASDLRFRQNETLAVLAAALGSHYDLETALRLHEMTEGWPLGVQLAVAALRRTEGRSSFMDAASAGIRRYFIDTLIDQQSPDVYQLLVRMAQFDLIHPDLCVAALGSDSVRDGLQHLAENTPVLLQAEGSEWMRLHPLAREVLGDRLRQLPVAERQLLSRRASTWLAEHDLHEAAAEQALLAGDTDVAFELAERSIRRMVMQGRIGAVLEWHGRMPAADLAHHPGFWAPIAWALAMSERHAEAGPLIESIQRQPDVAPADQFEADLLRATCAGFADRADDLAELTHRWPEPPALARFEDLPIYWISRGFGALYQGQPTEARRHWNRIGAFDRARAYSPMSYGFTEFSIGLSYLWEGRSGLAEEVLRPALVRAEERMDRRNLVACMLAALLAQARWDSGDDDEPAALLTLRLDVLERQGLPDPLLSVYLTLARIAEHAGHQDKALSLLEALRTLGVARNMPRLQFAAQCELVRLHAHEGRVETAHQLSRELVALFEAQRASLSQTQTPWLMLQVELARAHAAMAQPGSDRLPDALQALQAAGSLATSLHLGQEAIEARLLRAQVLRRCGAAEADALAAEALSLARAAGLQRLVSRYGEPASRTAPVPVPVSLPAAPPPQMPASTVAGSAMLTAKEREVLALLTQNLSNKEIALAMGSGEQTIKWHVKNLFTKLGGLNRKHAVARARVLGLIEH
jgi:LuxR family transcriptional regulator, maltose regulon positive regulatory protein